MVHTLDPIFRRDQAGLFAWQINSGALAEAEAGGVLVDAVDSEQFADVVKVDVAGSDDALVKIHGAVGVIAMEYAAVKRRVTRAI